MAKKRLNLRNVAMIACLAVSSVMFLSCNQSAKKTKVDSDSIAELLMTPPVVSVAPDFSVLPTEAEQDVTPTEEQPVTPVVVDYYGCEERHSNGRTFSIILALATKGEEKTITKFFVSEGIIERGTRNGYSYVSKKEYGTNIERNTDIKILDDNTFSSTEGKIPVSGKLEKDIIKGTAEYAGKKYPFEAKTSHVEICTTCRGWGWVSEGSEMKTCQQCEGFGFKISH